MADGAVSNLMAKSAAPVDLQSAVVARACAGDQRAFERLYREHVGRVYGLCLRMTRDPDIASDCTQEAFIKAWQALARFEARASFATWLHRIAVNTVLARRRRPASREESLDDVVDLEDVVVTVDTPVA